MAIAPISVGDKDARAKMNEVIAKANLVDEKAPVALVAAETAARQVAIAQEAAARGAGLSAEAAARRADILALPLPMPVQRRPGDAPLEFGRSLADGEAAGIAPLPDAMLRYDEAGKVVRLTGDDIVAPRHLFALEPGRRYLATFAVQRRVNSPDPDNDAIRCAFAWYGQGKGRLLATPQTVAQDLLGLTTGSGRQVVRAVVSRAAGADVDIVAPAGARYVRPYVQTYGTLVQSDVEVIDWADITDVVAFAPDVSALDARVAAQESIDAGDRLNELEAQVAAPNTVRFKTVGDLASAAVPVSADAFEVLGYASPSDRGGAPYRPSNSAPAHDGYVTLADGRFAIINSPVIRPESLGGDLQKAAVAASIEGARLKLTGGATYTVGPSFTFPSGLKIEGRGAMIRSDGTASGSQPIFVVDDDVEFDELFFSIPGSEATTELITIGANVYGGILQVIADAQKAGNGILTPGQDVRIDHVITDKIDRPLHLYNQSTTPVTGLNIGLLTASSYIRGLRADNVYGRIGGVRISGRSPNASLMTPGQNGILLSGDAGLEIGDCWIEDAPEHAIRVGGSATGTVSKTLKFGNILVKRSAGCAIKLNPTLLASPGVTETVNDVQIGNVLAIDIAEGSFAGNREILRLSHVRNVQIGNVLAVADQFTRSGQYGLQINDARNVQIASLGGPFNAGAISIDGASDVDGVDFFGGDVTGLRIGRLHGTMPGTNAIAVNTTFNVGDVHIHLDGLSGFTTNLCRWIAGTLTGPFRISGWVGGAVPPAYQGAPADDNFQADITWNNLRAIGRAGALRGSGALEVAPSPFNAASQAPNGLVLNSAKAPAGSGNYGAAVEWTRNGSSRRAAAIASRQGSADDKEVGLDFLTGDTNTTGNETLLLAMRLTHLQRVELPSTLTKYADNAAAVSAGLPVGTLYWTTTGEVRVVV